ncbi:Type I secretion system ABC transporter, PrtD family [Bosea sp. LC85]|uniref:type I secretion system permease/ATPase n=1 Tax=Bosea sp. LC85 TaxID=1502851 RepID=UPI0004E3BD18|nr:type I secretion system permease/ATPase [Bosea sp. LC85]KFC74780.1 Type I secretion system ABC transporter, PrtD family [Bosea sp. LC85]
MSPNVPSRDELRDALISQWRHFMFAGLFSSVINLLYLSSPLYLMQVYNRVLVSENVTTLAMLTLILTISLATMGALDVLRSQILIRCGVRLDAMLSGRVFEALVVRSARQGHSRGSQPLRELDQFRTFITGPGVYFAFDLPWIPLYLLLLFFIHPWLGALATLGAAGLLGLALLNERITRGSLRLSEAAGTRSFVFTENILRHSDVVVAMGMQPAIERNWSASRDSMMSEQAKASDRNALVASTIRFARLLLQALMLGVGAWLAIDHQIMPATIFAASIVMGRALVPVEQAVATWRQFNEAREGYLSVRTLLAEVPAVEHRTVVPPAGHALSVSDIAFSVPSRRDPIIKLMSFTVQAGQAVGLVGPSGSGKSTLARLLVGAIAPSDGAIRFGGLDYSQWERSELGRRIGYLPQDVGLFTGTVRENIARFGDASIDDIVEAARMTGIHEMVLDLPDQYDTLLGPGGVGLSGGQRQRLGLARALIGRPSLLVLDEPNANLDSQGEEALRNVLLALKAAGTTIVVVTHRNTVLDVVDALMFVRGGRMEKLGPPADVYAHIKATMLPARDSATVT